jgi:cytidyltransferase-like protein
MTVRGIVSGYFNPMHGGHIDYINKSKLHCDWLIAIINNDYQVALKGSRHFMDENHRKYIIENLKSVDETIISLDKDTTVCKSLNYLRDKYPEDDLFFFNSGDRQKDNLVTAETETCRKLKIKEVVFDQSKRYSSSELLMSL